MRTAIAALLLFVLLCCFVSPSAEFFCRCKPGTFTGSLFGAPYTIKIPKKWNEVLIVYARDYQDDQPTTADAFWPGFNTSEDFETPLLDLGYALAGSALSSGGWAVANGINDIFALTSYFRLRHCWPRHTILVGVSMGGVIAMKSIEKFGFLYDAAIPACSLAAGTTKSLDLSVRWNLAFGSVFGWPPFFGNSPADIAVDIDQNTVFGYYLQLLANTGNFPGFEFIRLIMDLPDTNLFYGTATPYVLVDAKFATFVIADIEKKYGGTFTQNVGHLPYALGDAELELLVLEIEGLTQEGIPTFDPTAPATWLATMNSQTFVADQRVRARVAHDGDYTGHITGPVLTMHTIDDPLSPIQGETLYKELVESAGKGNRLLQVWTGDQPGHCEFNPQEFVGVIQAMHSWLKTGKRPSPDDNNFFPTSSGFVQDFNPGPWPYF